MSLIAALMGIVGLGLSHGVNPSHGWPIAMLYSMRSKNPLFGGIISSAIIACAHFVSSIVVVVTYIFVVDTFAAQIPQIYLRYGAAIALGILAYFFWKEKAEDLVQTQHGHLHGYDKGKTTALLQIDHRQHEHIHWHKGLGYHLHIHIHQKRSTPSLKAIVSFAFVLGFAHEEEFVILALATSQTIDPITLMIAYALSVTAALIGITVICMKVYQRFQYKIIQYSKYLPKISAILLIFMALAIAIGLF